MTQRGRKYSGPALDLFRQPHLAADPYSEAQVNR